MLTWLKQLAGAYVESFFQTNRYVYRVYIYKHERFRVLDFEHPILCAFIVTLIVFVHSL